MQSTLRNLFLASAVVATAALATSTARADIRVNVPFSFTAAGKTCPPGMYSIERDATSGLVTLRNMDWSRSFTWIAASGDPSPRDTRVLLQFDELGGTHALRSVQYGDVITPRLDKKPKHPEYVPTRIVEGQ